MEYSSDNRRIAKNTLMLYFRMFITMLVGLYTSRVFLSALGFDDYGIYNVVGGVIGMMGVVTGLLSQSTMRFLTYSIGSDNIEGQKHTFSALLLIHIALAAIIIVLGETIGLWFLNTHVVFDASRTDTVNFVYQLSLIGACIGIIQVPFYASVIAKEKMNFFAYISIYDVVVKLLIVFVLFVVDFDKLMLYASMLLVCNIITFMFYRLYCKRHFEFCSFRLVFYKELYKKMVSYTGWGAIGAVAFTFNGQGITVLLNMFFGPAVNAARAVAMMVSNMVNQFVTNFQTSINPQIIKSYAGGDVERSTQLVINNAKFSSYLLLLFAIPLFIETENVLSLWLGNFPDYTIEFARLALVQMLIQAIDYPVGTGIHAVGKMKLPQLSSSLIYMLILPICYMALKMGAQPVAVYIISVCVFPMAFCSDLLILHHYTGFPILRFIKEVPLKTMIIIAVAAILPTYIHYNMESGFVRLVVVCVVSLVISSCLIYRFGLGVETRQQLLIFVKSRLPKR
ncbi:MAG: hypothetical protein ACI4AH_00155 [Muribaculaceae bacterium]